MGLSASQARLLSLTARMADLELRSQQISNAKVRLSNESSDASRAYTNALDDQMLKVYSGVTSDGNATYADATAYNLTHYNPDNAISDVQRLLKNESGDLLLDNELAEAYDASGGNLEAFLNGIHGNVGPYTSYANEPAKIVSLAVPLAGQLSAQEASVADEITSTVKTEATFNVYTTSVTTVGITGFTTAYNDASIHSFLASNCSIAAYYNWDDSDLSDGDPYYAYSASGAPNVINFADFNESSLGGIASALNSVVGDICNDTGSALNAVLSSYYGSNWQYVASAISNAEAYASSMTVSHYVNQANSGNYIDCSDAFSGVNNWMAIIDAANYNGYTGEYNTGTKDQEYLDASQVVKMYLNYFDAACSDMGNDNSINGSVDTSGYTSRNHLYDAYRVDDYDTYGDNTGDYYYVSGGTVTRGSQGGTDGANSVSTQIDSVGAFGYYTYITTIATTPTTKTTEITNFTQSQIDASGYLLLTGLPSNQDYALTGLTTTTTYYSTVTTDQMVDMLTSIMGTISTYEDEFNVDYSSTSNVLSSFITGLQSGLTGTDASNLYHNIALFVASFSIPTSVLLQAGLTTTYTYNTTAASYYKNIYDETVKAAGGTWIAGKGYDEISDWNMNDPEWLQKQIDDGTIYLYEYDKKGGSEGSGMFENTSWTSGDNTLSEESDNSGLAKAEADYESAMAVIKAKDEKFDLELKKIDTEHSSIQSEVESVQKAIDKDIERNFKMFDA